MQEQEQDEAWFIETIDASLPQLSPSTRIARVPVKLRETSDYDKYYVPKVVSIGPYHYKNEKLEYFENLKSFFAKQLLGRDDLKSLYKKLGDANMVQELKKLYDEESTDRFSDRDFTKMMALDGCFILFYIQNMYKKKHSEFGLGRHKIKLICQDLFLVENQIPFKVLKQVMDLKKFNWNDTIGFFVTENTFAQELRLRSGWLFPTNSTPQIDENDHLLHRLYCSLTGTTSSNVKTQKYRTDHGRSNSLKKDSSTAETSDHRRIFHTVKELQNIGIHFKPSSRTHLDNVDFVDRCWWISANLKLPPLTIDRLLNLLAYELNLGDGNDDWVRSYICLLASLIDQSEDVWALRNAGVLDYPLGKVSDDEVAAMFHNIVINLDPNHLAYWKVKRQIQIHYDKWKSAHLTELKDDYFKSPWSILAVLGGVLVLFLSGVQTYFTVWSPESECDHLCKFLKMNHHL